MDDVKIETSKTLTLTLPSDPTSNIVSVKLYHEFGNLVLQQVAQRFSRSLPTGAVLARLGGDEFGVLVNGTYEQTLEAAYALEATLSYPFVIEGNTIKIGVSIGHVQNDGSHNALERADAAMYEAKRSGVGVVRAQPVL